jgi:hypothetical protein
MAQDAYIHHQIYNHTVTKYLLLLYVYASRKWKQHSLKHDTCDNQQDITACSMLAKKKFFPPSKTSFPKSCTQFMAAGMHKQQTNCIVPKLYYTFTQKSILKLSSTNVVNTESRQQIVM